MVVKKELNQKIEAPEHTHTHSHEAVPQSQSKKKVKKEKKSAVLAVIRIRGEVNVSENHEKTMQLLRLSKKHRCVLIPSTPAYLGMLQKVHDFCTFGEVDEDMILSLIEKRGRTKGNSQVNEKFVKDNYKSTFKEISSQIFSMSKGMKDFDLIKPFFKLHPPVGGYERKGIKKPYSVGGALGYRGAEINKLLRKMI